MIVRRSTIDSVTPSMTLSRIVPPGQACPCLVNGKIIPVSPWFSDLDALRRVVLNSRCDFACIDGDLAARYLDIHQVEWSGGRAGYVLAGLLVDRPMARAVEDSNLSLELLVWFPWHSATEVLALPVKRQQAVRH